MIPKMHRTRRNFEKLYTILCDQLKQGVAGNFYKWGDYQLLVNINELLIKSKCQPMTNDELIMELSE